jgi:hypothetical protein
VAGFLMQAFGSSSMFCFCFLRERWSHCVVQAGLELVIFLAQPPKYWDYRHAPLCPVWCLLLSLSQMRMEVESEICT